MDTITPPDGSSGEFPIQPARVLCACLDDPPCLWDRRICVANLSKNVRGMLALMRSESQKCADPYCEILKTDHSLRLQIDSAGCDSPPSDSALDGFFFTRQLVTAFVDDGMSRGHHTGDFDWIGQGVVVKGSMSGMTNVGTLRAPPLPPYHGCSEVGWMEGRLCGHVVESHHPDFPVGCAVTSAYRFQFEGGDAAAQDFGLRGVFEGVTVCPCFSTEEGCIDFTARVPMSVANPWVVEDHRFEVSDGGPTITADVVTMNGLTGLDVKFETSVALGAPASSVDLTMVHFAEPPTVRALGPNGNLLRTVTMAPASGVPETLSLSGSIGQNIESLIINAPQTDALLLKLCTR